MVGGIFIDLDTQQVVGGIFIDLETTQVVGGIFIDLDTQQVVGGIFIDLETTQVVGGIFIDLDTQQVVGGNFIDLEKAFDTVNHTILCDKLNYYGFRGKINELIKSFLSNRSRYVSINGFDSIKLDVTCGVPQGYTLGPLFDQSFC